MRSRVRGQRRGRRGRATFTHARDQILRSGTEPSALVSAIKAAGVQSQFKTPNLLQ